MVLNKAMESACHTTLEQDKCRACMLIHFDWCMVMFIIL